MMFEKLVESATVLIEIIWVYFTVCIVAISLAVLLDGKGDV